MHRGRDRPDGEVTRLLCTYDPETAGGQAPDGRKVKATIHWVSADHAVDLDVALYERLFTDPHPGADGEDPLASLNPDAKTMKQAKAEPAIADIAPGDVVQFERLGYFARRSRRRSVVGADDVPSHGRPARRVGQHPEAPGDVAVGVERAVIPVDDLGAAIERFEAEGYRLVTISPADAPRIADLDGPDRLVRLDATATEAAVITVEPRPLLVPDLVPSS